MKSNSKCQKKLTKARKERKLRNVGKIIYAQEKLVLYMNTFQDVLPIFKSFVLAFEQKTPQIRKLHNESLAPFVLFCAIFASTKKLIN